MNADGRTDAASGYAGIMQAPHDAVIRSDVASEEAAALSASGAPNLPLIGACAGVLTGILEFMFAAPNSAWQHEGSVVLVLAVTCSLLGFCGFVYGALLHLVNAFATARLRFILKLALVAAVAAAAASRYRSVDAAIIAAGLSVGIAWAWWRSSARGCAVILAWSILLYVLHPLFNGHAMDRVFTERETIGVLLVVVCVLPVMASALLSATVPSASGSTVSAMLKAAAAAVVAAIFTACSSIFLIRLWGFNTMGYLEVTLLGLKIGSLVISLTIVFAYWPVRVWRSRREANLIAMFVLLALFALSAYTGMRHDIPAQSLLAELPDTSFIANRAASLLDRDRDGFSAAFGFGDCNDSNRYVNPGAIDWPGDGTDENCFGGDLKSAAHAYFNLPISVEAPAPAAPPKRRKIVVFVLLDTVRADAVDYSGAPGTVTPEIAKIAGRGIRFDRAYAQSNNTVESMPFLLHLGFRDFPRYHQPWTLVNQFKDGGVDSVAVFQSGPRLWFGELDDVFVGFDKRLYPDEHTGYRTDEQTVQVALDELAAHTSDAPFFLYVHFESVHDSFTRLMEGERITQDGLNLSEVARLWKIQEMVALMKERYLKALASVDTAVGHLWDGVQHAAPDADVLFIVTADHGEEFYDHGGLFHMGTLHEELVRVPLIIYHTGGAPRVESMPVGLYRVPGTILQWLGYRGTFLEEMNLLRQPLRPYEIFGYFALDGDWQRRTFMVVDGNDKLIYDSGRGRVELYDLANDPHEQHNLAADPRYRDAQQRLTQKMDATLFFMNYGDIEYIRLLRERARTAGNTVGVSPEQPAS